MLLVNCLIHVWLYDYVTELIVFYFIYSLYYIWSKIIVNSIRLFILQLALNVTTNYEEMNLFMHLWFKYFVS